MSFMTGLYSDIKTKFGDFVRHDSFVWFDRSYVVDWSVTMLFLISACIIEDLAPFEREFDRKDPLISYSHKSNQISGVWNWRLSVLMPLAVMASVGCLRRSVIEVHHSCLALLAGSISTKLVTECLKNRVGRLRPDFLARCKWDKDVKACTGKFDTVLDGRRSFPSGHSSTAFSGMMFLSLWIAGMTGAWCLSTPAPARNILASKLARLSLSLVPLVFAAWVAVSRIEDYRHHVEDVIAGALIGISCATACYLIYWPNPFIPNYAAHSILPPRARMVYTDDDTTRARDNYAYELAEAGRPNGLEPV